MKKPILGTIIKIIAWIVGICLVSYALLMIAVVIPISKSTKDPNKYTACNEIFPKIIPLSAKNTVYYDYLCTSLLDDEYIEYLTFELSDEEFKSEVNRIKSIQHEITLSFETEEQRQEDINIKKTDFAENIKYETVENYEDEHMVYRPYEVTYFTKPYYDTETFYYPAYVVESYDSKNAYALIIEVSNKIVYLRTGFTRNLEKNIDKIHLPKVYDKSLSITDYFPELDIKSNYCDNNINVYRTNDEYIEIEDLSDSIS